MKRIEKYENSAEICPIKPNHLLIRYSSDPHRLLEQVFSSAKPIVARIPGGEEPPRVEVVAKADEIGQVVGRNGVNIRLASRLSGRQIDARVP